MMNGVGCGGYQSVEHSKTSVYGKAIAPRSADWGSVFAK